MNILWLNHKDPLHSGAGGAEATIYHISKRLYNFGHEVTIGTSNQLKGKKEYCYEGVRVIRHGTNLSSHLRVLEFKNDFDVVIDDLAHIIPWFTPQLLKIPCTAFFRHLHRRTLQGQVPALLCKPLSYLEQNYKRIYKQNTFVTESRRSVMDLVKLGINLDRISKISPGVDSSVFKPAEKYETPTIVYFAGFRDYKRPEHVIDMFRMIKGRLKNVSLVMIGNGPSLERVKQKASKYRLRDIKFTGRVDRQELAKIVAKSWLNVHTSVAEGWGYSIMEASASGTPTVAYGVPGVTESVIDGVNGIKVMNGDVEKLTESAVLLLEGSHGMMGSSRKFAQEFSWDTSAKLWETHLRNIVE